MNIKVTKATIKDTIVGVRFHGGVSTPNHCMIAEAIRDQGYIRVFVDERRIAFTDPDTGLRHVYDTPKNAVSALKLFDTGTEPKPFVVVLEGGTQTPSVTHTPRAPRTGEARRKHNATRGGRTGLRRIFGRTKRIPT